MSKLKVPDAKNATHAGGVLPADVDPAAESAAAILLDARGDDDDGVEESAGDAPKPNWDQFFRDLRRGKSE